MAASPKEIARAPAGIVSVIDQDEANARRVSGLLAQLGVEVQAYPTAGCFLSRPSPDPDCIICDMTLDRKSVV